MPVKIYHPKRGYVLTNNNFEVDELLAEGGVIIKKNREAEPMSSLAQEDDLIGDVESLKPEQVAVVTRRPAQRKSKLI